MAPLDINFLVSLCSRYFKVLIQEMAVKVDQGFLSALIQLFSSGKAGEEEEQAAFQHDRNKINSDLMADAIQSSLEEQRHFYDMLHFSPLKVHLSFSLHGSNGSEESGKVDTSNFNVLNLFLQSVGIVLTDVDDVVFK